MTRLSAACQTQPLMSDVPQIFDVRLRRRRRERAASTFVQFSFLADAVGEEIGDRIVATPRAFARAVWCGAWAPPDVKHIAWIRGDSVERFVPRGGAVFEEEQLPFAERVLDLYVSALTLHAVNDLPGALTQIRRSLKPDSLFMAAMFGGQSLHELRSCLAEAEIEIDGGLSPRVSPLVDVRDAGALLQRAGFGQPVADVDAITVRYEHPLKLLSDLRGMGETNVLTQRRRSFLKRQVLGRAFEIYGAKFRGPDGRVPATFEILYLTGWSPAKKPT
jgi:NADH dehydrogenase [ubiquinone] 1 alpha subcomplex assembly factor 5